MDTTESIGSAISINAPLIYSRGNGIISLPNANDDIRFVDEYTCANATTTSSIFRTSAITYSKIATSVATSAAATAISFDGLRAAFDAAKGRLSIAWQQSDWAEPTINISFNPTYSSEYCYGTWAQACPSKEDILRQRMRNNLAPKIITKNRDLWGVSISDDERRARQLLFELVGEASFRRYLRRGFIMVQGRSGTMYKISGGTTRVISYVKGPNGNFEPYESFCVQFKQYDLPFTDGVIMRKLLVENDEFSLRKESNVCKLAPAMVA